MLLKMLGIERAWDPDAGPKPRQVFVTQSPVLAKKVKDYFTKLMSSFEVPAHSTQGIGRDIAEADVGQEAEGSEQEDGLIGQEYGKRWRSDLPEKFGELQDENFPLFITYGQVRVPSFSKHSISLLREQLCTMLENDIGLGHRGNASSTVATRRGATSLTSPTPPWKAVRLVGSQIASLSDYMQQPRENFVSYGVFLSSYWDHLPQATIRRLGEKLQIIHELL